MNLASLRPAWWQDAACRGRPTSWWFPDASDTFTTRVALAVCARCPVRAACLADAVELEAIYRQPAGIRGGTTDKQRTAAAALALEAAQEAERLYRLRHADQTGHPGGSEADVFVQN